MCIRIALPLSRVQTGCKSWNHLSYSGHGGRFYSLFSHSFVHLWVPSGWGCLCFSLGKITVAAVLHVPFGSFLAGLSCPFGKVRQGKGGTALSWRIRRYSASRRLGDRVVCVQPSPFMLCFLRSWGGIV